MISKHDNRVHPRVKIAPGAPEVQVHLFTDGGGSDTRRVRALDLSRTGMSFHDAAAWPDGTRCTVLINHRQRAIRIIGKVVNSHPQGAGEGFVVGLKFTSITPIASEGLSMPLCDDPAVDRLLIDMPDK